MPISDLFRLALESIRANRLRAGLTMLGMIIGVASVVLLVSIGNGARNYITHEFEGMGANLIFVQPGKTDVRSGFGPPTGNSSKRLKLADVEAIEKQAVHIEAVTGIVFGSASVRYAEKSRNVNMLGTNEQMPKIFNLVLSAGDYFSKEEAESGRRLIVIGASVAEHLFGDEAAVGMVVKVNEVEFRVAGLIRRAGESLGFNLDELVLVPVRAGMRLFNEDKLFGIRAKAKSKSSVNDAMEEMKQILIARNDGKEEFTMFTQESMLTQMNSILGMLTFVLAGIACISLLVGGIGIMNIMLVSVTERTREIGIRRAVGARSRDVLLQFLIEAVVLSLVGGAIGLLGSTGMAWIAYAFKPSFDMRPEWWVLLPSFGVSVSVGILFGVWPARRASRIPTIDALRYE